jgi:hypothetical protein
VVPVDDFDTIDRCSSGRQIRELHFDIAGGTNNGLVDEVGGVVDQVVEVGVHVGCGCRDRPSRGVVEEVVEGERVRSVRVGGEADDGAGAERVVGRGDAHSHVVEVARHR